MKRLYKFLLCASAWICSFPLFSEQKIVELVADFKTECENFSSVLQMRNCDARVITSNLNHYGIGVRGHSRIEKFLHKYSLDFWKKITLKDSVERIVFFNLRHIHRNDLYFDYLPKDKLVLFMFEPPVILPKMYAKKAAEPFGRVYTWDDDLVDGVKFLKFYYPVLRPMIEEIPSFEDKKFCTLINTKAQNKSTPGCLYDDRIKAIRYFENAEEEGFEFYGRRWDPALYKSYRGAVDDKYTVLKNYRFSICYENCSNSNGYVTEKIFDCFAAGCVPIYWGAPNIEKYIPKECFIDRRDFSSMEELHAFLKNMGKEEYEGYIARIRAFLSSEQAQLFSSEHFNQLFYEAVTADDPTCRNRSVTQELINFTRPSWNGKIER
ncbi:MAG TPA: glycosyltransferase family 10 [Rhabdochlamydiaceae bacterium]|jgi:hypothetical protein